jgi:predicted subunit of tRNA(5-methylaminomethyl-2-thiouridylate) methyltransferase
VSRIKDGEDDLAVLPVVDEEKLQSLESRIDKQQVKSDLHELLDKTVDKLDEEVTTTNEKT